MLSFFCKPPSIRLFEIRENCLFHPILHCFLSQVFIRNFFPSCFLGNHSSHLFHIPIHRSIYWRNKSLFIQRNNPIILFPSISLFVISVYMEIQVLIIHGAFDRNLLCLFRSEFRNRITCLSCRFYFDSIGLIFFQCDQSTVIFQINGRLFRIFHGTE